jgi:molecular chaperone DnaK
MSKIIGIDLGTTNSAVAVVEGGVPRILENAEGARTTPSIVALGKTGEQLVGLLAKRQAITNPKGTVFGIKRFIGHGYDEASIERDKKTVPYEITRADNGGVRVTMSDKKHSPEEVSAMILAKIKKDAEAKLGEAVTKAVITVPAYFNDQQRQATKDAGKIAGLEVMRIINEPTAAALAYGLDKKKEEKIVVYDFGGGTFDVSVLEVGADLVEVKSTDGDSHMGGRDIDYKLIQWIAEEFKKETGVDVSKDPLALQRLDEAAEKAKIELSTALESEINIPFIAQVDGVPAHLQKKLTRAKLEEIADEFVARSMEITERAIKASPFKKEEIAEIILVGGQTRMPLIIERVKAFFGKEPNRSINPDEVVALGAAVQGGILTGEVKDVLLLDVIPLSLGLETAGGVATKLVDGIPPAPRGGPQIEVTFDVDANGILAVKAKDKATGKEQSIRIEARSGLSDADIERMKKDAEAYAADDAKKRELAEAKNHAEQAIYAAEKALREHGGKVSPEINQEVEAAARAAREAKDKDDVATIKSTTDALVQASMKIGEAMAKAGAEAPKAEGEAAAPASEGPARDAEASDKKPEQA